MLKHINLWVVLGAFAVMAFLIVFWGGVLLLFYPGHNNTISPTAMIKIIPVPSSTPLTITPTSPQSSGTGDKIAIGMTVQVSGTGKDGLRLRAAPGINSDVHFIGYESESYLVKDGPKDADGYTWWYLVGVDYPTKNGWGASIYLKVTAAP